MSKNLIHLSLSIGSGLALGLAWPTQGLTLMVFVALIPLLYLEEDIGRDKNKRKGVRVFAYSYLTFLIWNLITTWWLINSSVFGMLFVNLTNSLLYTLIFSLFHWTKGRLNQRSSYIFLIALWLTFEKFHLYWDISMTWLNFGNVFSEKIYWIQWYEYTGVFGGSLWVLTINVWLYSIIKKHNTSSDVKLLIRKTTYPLLAIALPICFSLLLYQRVPDKQKTITVTLVQPNIDPYKTKYELTNSTFLIKLFNQLKPHITSKTDYILAPETYFADGLGEELKSYTETKLHQGIQKELSQFPNTQLITGIQYYDLFVQSKAPSLTANLARKGLWVEYYNSAVSEYFNEIPEYYHKSKLVAGVENMPFKSILKPLIGDILIDFGGTVASRIIQKKRSVFIHPRINEKAGPVICWESIFGEYVTGYVKEGATFLAVITNDSWWGETPGHRQLLSYTRLRAIETRRDIARSANTGISCLINAKGEILEKTAYNTKSVLNGNIAPRNTITFYVKYGDIIARWAILIALLYFLLAISGRLKIKKEI